MSSTDTARSIVTHRGMSCLDLHRLLGQQDRELRTLRPRAAKATALEARIDEQAKTICSLTDQLADATRNRDDVNAKAERYDEAEARAQAAEELLAELRDELLELRAFKANATPVTVPPMERDTTAIEDQATAPAGTNVTTLREAAAAGHLSPIVQVSRSGASANPEHPLVTWGREDDTQPLAKMREAS